MAATPRPFRLLLLRHGQTPSNVSGALDTAEPGPGLTTLGHTQATTAEQALTRESIDAVYVSRLRRTHETAAPLARARRLDPVTLDGLAEVRAGAFEMGTDHAAIEGYIGTIAAWIEGDHDLRMPGAETGHEFLARYDAAVARIAATGHSCAMVISHGAAIRTWVSSRIDTSSGDPGGTQPLHNTALITLRGHPALGWELLDWHAEPIGGRFLEDERAQDPTGEPAEE